MNDRLPFDARAISFLHLFLLGKNDQGWRNHRLNARMVGTGGLCFGTGQPRKMGSKDIGMPDLTLAGTRLSL